MSWLSVAIDTIFKKAKPVLKSEAKDAIDAAIDRAYASAENLTAAQLKELVNREIDKL